MDCTSGSVTDNCVGGSCGCGNGGECAPGTRCENGQCKCDMQSGCAGCCQSGDTCLTGTEQAACGTGGNTCFFCMGQCFNGLCTNN